jgi:Fic family protein
MHSLDINYLSKLNFSVNQLTTLQMIGEYRGKQSLYFQQTPELLESLRKRALIESNEASNRLEGIIAPHHRVAAIALKSTQPQNRSEQEIAGYRDALDILHESAAHMELSSNIILQLHSAIYRYLSNQGGRWKMQDNEIIEKHPNGMLKAVRFKPVSAIVTPQTMDSLIQRYKLAINQYHFEPLLIIPLTILDFLCIHPFTDGNGRTARLMILLMLYHFDYQVGRYISLERIFENTKERYYETLKQSSEGWHEGVHDVTPWVNYFWSVLLQAYRQLEERVGTIIQGKGAKTSRIRMAIKRKLGTFSISSVEIDCPGISRDMIRRVLRQMRDENEIVAIGKGRNAKWKTTPHANISEHAAIAEMERSEK